MCIICIELEKNKITPLEARRSLAEMAFDIDLDHFFEVEEKIQEIQNKNEFITLLNSDKAAGFCPRCDCDPCDCDWGTNE